MTRWGLVICLGLVGSASVAKGTVVAEICSAELALLSEVKEPGKDGRKPLDIYADLIAALLRRNSLSLRFQNDLAVSLKPLNPFDYGVINLKIVEYSRFASAFKTLFKIDLSSAWAHGPQREKLTALLKKNGESHGQRVQAENMTKPVWAAIKKELGLSWPTAFQTTEYRKSWRTGSGAGYESFFHLRDGEIFYANLATGLLNKMVPKGTLKILSNPVVLLHDAKGNPYALFSDGKRIKLIDALTGLKRSEVDLASKQFTGESWFRFPWTLEPLGGFSSDGTPVILMMSRRRETTSLGRFTAGGTQFIDFGLNLERNPSQASVNGRLVLAFADKGKITVLAPDDGTVLASYPLPRGVGTKTAKPQLHAISGRLYLTMSALNKFHFYDLASAKSEVLDLPTPEHESLRPLSFGSREGRRIFASQLSSAEQNQVMLFEPGLTPKVFKFVVPDSHNLQLYQLIQGPDGRLYLIANLWSADNRVVETQALDVDTGMVERLDLKPFNVRLPIIFENTGNSIEGVYESVGGSGFQRIQLLGAVP